MNYLAHIFLSGNQPEIQIGNFIGDFVKGNSYKNYPEKIAKGILLHRKIDNFTDQHYLTRELKNLLRPEFGRYSGIIADMYLDYFLAIYFRDYSGKSLYLFSRLFYLNTLLHYKHLPQKVKKFIFHFIFTDRLGKYASIEGLKKSLEIMSYHKVPALQPEHIVNFLQLNKSDIDIIFRKLFSDIQIFVQAENEMIAVKSW